MWGKAPPGLWSHITIPSESFEYILIADMIVYYIVCVLIAIIAGPFPTEQLLLSYYGPVERRQEHVGPTV